MYDMQLLYVFSLIVFTVALDISRDNVNETTESIEIIESEANDTTEDYDVIEKRKFVIIRKIAVFLVILIYVVFFIRCCIIGYEIVTHLWRTRCETFDKSRLEQNNQSRIEHQVDDSDKHTEERSHRRTNKQKEKCKYNERDKRMHKNRNKNRDGTDIVLNNLSMDDDSDKYSIFKPRPERKRFLAQTSKVHSPRINNSISNSGISVELVKLNHKAQVHAEERNDN